MGHSLADGVDDSFSIARGTLGRGQGSGCECRIFDHIASRRIPEDEAHPFEIAGCVHIEVTAAFPGQSQFFKRCRFQEFIKHLKALERLQGAEIVQTEVKREVLVCSFYFSVDS